MTRSRIAGLVFVLLSWAALLHVVVPPLAWLPREQRGDYLYGRFSLNELYVVIPFGIFTLAATLVFLLPARVRRPVGHRVFAVVLSSLAALGLFDLWFALVHLGAWKPDFWLDNGFISRLHNEPDDELGFRRIPRVSWLGSSPVFGEVVEYRTDARGFRNPVDLDRADIVFIGDSYTEAAQIHEQQTFPQLVGERTGMTVVNLGRGAYGPLQEMVVLWKYGLAMEPDAVVWQFFEGNDLADTRNYKSWSGDRNQVTTNLLDRYLMNSFFEKWLARTVRSRRGEFARLALPDGTELPLALRYRHEPAIRDRAAFTEIDRSVRLVADACQKRGIRLLVVAIPTFAHAARPFLSIEDETLRESFLPPSAGGGSEFAASLERLCGELGCGFLDALPLLRAALQADPRDVYLLSDEHFAPRGHAVLADAIADWVESGRSG